MAAQKLTWTTLLIVLGAIGPCANATTINFDFSASLTSGPLAGTTFTGTGSYDLPAPPLDLRALPLTSFDFSILGVPITGFTRVAQIAVIDGAVTTFQVTVTTIPPEPIDQIDFGFTVPLGVISYTSGTGPNLTGGSGSYEITSSSATPEPSALTLCGSALLLALILFHRKRVFRTVLAKC